MCFPRAPKQTSSTLVNFFFFSSFHLSTAVVSLQTKTTTWKKNNKKNEMPSFFFFFCCCCAVSLHSTLSINNGGVFFCLRYRGESMAFGHGTAHARTSRQSVSCHTSTLGLLGTMMTAVCCSSREREREAARLNTKRLTAPRCLILSSERERKAI